MKVDVPYPDSSGCLGSYLIGESPLTIDLPPESCHWRVKRKHFKIYVKDANLGGKSKADLKSIPPNSKSVTIKPSHGNFTSSYEYIWE